MHKMLCFYDNLNNLDTNRSTIAKKQPETKRDVTKRN